MNLLRSFLLAISMIFSIVSGAQKNESWSIRWDVVAELPGNGLEKALGLAGPLTGMHNNVLIVAGGANFPDGMPWMGGKKKYYQDIYVLQKKTGNDFSWHTGGHLKLQKKLAYSGNISLPEGIVCIGGETDTGHTSEVFMLQWDNSTKDIFFRDLPNLPFELANAAVTHIGKTIYVAGGEDGQKVLNSFLKLDLSVPDPQWEILPPLPIAISHATAAAQLKDGSQCIYVFGGRAKANSGLSDLYNTVFCFDPRKNSWKQVANISDGKNTSNLSAATSVEVGDNCILLIGGDNGIIFHQIETFNDRIARSGSEEERKRLQADKIKLLNEHPGFSRQVLAYNTSKDHWIKVGDLPGFGPVTTTAVLWGNDIFIPSGEVKPGRRTPEILVGKIIK